MLSGQVQEKAMKLHAVASVNLLIEDSPDHVQNGGLRNGTADKNSNKKQMQVHAISNGHMPRESLMESPNFSSQFVSPNIATSPTDDAAQSSSTTRNSNRTDESTVESPQIDSENNVVSDAQLTFNLSQMANFRLFQTKRICR